METAFVYILTNRNNSVLYSGSTTSLKKRIYHHRNKMIPGFSEKYGLQKLVYYETCVDKDGATKREIQLKKSSRKSKLALVDNFNPQWADLYDQLEQATCWTRRRGVRLKQESIFQYSFFDTEESLPLTVKDYRTEYRRISDRLNAIPEIVEVVHRDLVSSGTSNRGRTATFSSDSILRALIVKQKEGIDFREACIRISESEFLQDFCMLTRKRSIDYTTLCKAFNSIEDSSWELINQLLANQSLEDKEINVDVIRTDSTVVETNIHWPTDSSLLWDVYRVVSRIIEKLRTTHVGVIPFRFHVRKIKSLHAFITRYASSNSKKRKRHVQRKMRILLERVEVAIANARTSFKLVKDTKDASLLLAQMNSFLPAMQKVTSCARRRWINQEKVPVSEKVFSIFESHSELIQRGRRDKPIEFGHKIVISQSREKFITGYQVLEEKVDDRSLLEPVIEQHVMQYGKVPNGLTADKGFCPDNETYSSLEECIEFLEIPRRSRDYSDILLRSAQHFRAGIEGSISCLKRAFRLSRCFFKGFKSFSSAIGSAIFCHNLTVLARQTE